MSFQPPLTPRIAAEILPHEGVVPEAYRDSVGVWTWGVGVTDASDHRVGRYRDNPQSLARCLDVYLWLLETRYLPPVLDAFQGYALAEHELAAALSFHWNTGAIGRAKWVKVVKAGDREAARRAMMEWCRPAALRARREAECALFFDQQWSGDGTTLVWRVAKPSYRPINPRRQDIMQPLASLFEGTAPAPKPRPMPTPRKLNWFERLFLPH